MSRRLISLAALVLLLVSTGAYAQTPGNARVVSSCGTPDQTYTAGTNKPLTQDTTGKTCVDATVVVPPVTAVSAADAAATSPVTAPGAAKPMNESLFGELWVAPSLGGVPVLGADTSTFTAGTSTIFSGGFYQTTATDNPLTDGKWGAWQMTAQRAGFVNLRNASGAETGLAAAPLFVGPGTTSTGAAASDAAAPFATQMMVSNSIGVVRLLTPSVLGAGVTGNNMLASGSYVYNGASFDPMPGSAALGVSTNVTKLAGTAVSVNGGNVDNGTQRVVLATDQPTNTNPIKVTQGCAGRAVADTSVTPINSAGAATTLKLATGALGKAIYVCAINIGPTGAAVNVALVSGTKVSTECDTSTLGMAGGATAATGWNIAANGGLTFGNGIGVVAKTAGTNTDVCLLIGSTVQVSGTITWSQF